MMKTYVPYVELSTIDMYRSDDHPSETSWPGYPSVTWLALPARSSSSAPVSYSIIHSLTSASRS